MGKEKIFVGQVGADCKINGSRIRARLVVTNHSHSMVKDAVEHPELFGWYCAATDGCPYYNGEAKHPKNSRRVRVINEWGDKLTINSCVPDRRVNKY